MRYTVTALFFFGRAPHYANADKHTTAAEKLYDHYAVDVTLHSLCQGQFLPVQCIRTEHAALRKNIESNSDIYIYTMRSEADNPRRANS